MTGQVLYTTALDLCGLRKTDGSQTADTDDLKQRALSMINTLLAENAELDCRIRRSTHRVRLLESLDENIDCTEVVAASVLPYGLARLMMLGEDDAVASIMNKLYNDARANALRFGRAKAEAITEVYG